MYYIKDFKSFLSEEPINEIGKINLNNLYDYELMYSRNTSNDLFYDYDIYIDDGKIIALEIKADSREKELDFRFGLSVRDKVFYKTDLNLGSSYVIKLMNTLFLLLKEALDNAEFEIDYITFHSVKSDRRRAKLYLKYLNKNFNIQQMEKFGYDYKLKLKK